MQDLCVEKYCILLREIRETKIHGEICNGYGLETNCL